MYIYLPIAEISMHIAVVIGLGGGVGFLSGMFGVGGGFLMTPLLIFLGVPSAVAVSTEANQIVASSVSGVLAHWRRGNVDFKMGGILLAGGLVGSSVGVLLFSILRDIGQIDLVIRLSYVVFLGIIGVLMLMESVRAILRTRQPGARRGKLHQHNWLHGLPLKVRFRKSKLYISALLPFFLAAFVGVLSAIMGVGGGFILVPAMIYLLGMPTYTVIGTSLVPNYFCHREYHHSAGGADTDCRFCAGWPVAGWRGYWRSVRGPRRGLLRGEQLRGLLALIVLAVCLKLGFDLVDTPEDIFSVEFLK